MLHEKDPQSQIQNLSYMMANLNIIYPFCEGNGWSIREFIRCMALEYGRPFNWGNTNQDLLLDADVASVDDDMTFCDIL